MNIKVLRKNRQLISSNIVLSQYMEISELFPKYKIVKIIGVTPSGRHRTLMTNTNDVTVFHFKNECAYKKLLVTLDEKNEEIP